jgi:hypothetical protein
VAYFLNKSSNARRASPGRAALLEYSFWAPFVGAGAIGAVSFSTVMRISKNEQLFFALFFMIASGIGCVHSNCAPVSKFTHCLQQ